MASYQEIVSFGFCQAFLKPQQLSVGLNTTSGSSGLLVKEVVRVATQQHRVQHDDSQSAVRSRNAEVHLIIVVGEVPVRQN